MTRNIESQSIGNGSEKHYDNEKNVMLPKSIFTIREGSTQSILFSLLL